MTTTLAPHAEVVAKNRYYLKNEFLAHRLYFLLFREISICTWHYGKFNNSIILSIDST